MDLGASWFIQIWGRRLPEPGGTTHWESSKVCIPLTPKMLPAKSYVFKYVKATSFFFHPILLFKCKCELSKLSTPYSTC